MRRTIIVIMMFYAMLNCIANVSVTQSMYLPSQNVATEFMAVESYGGLFGESTSHQSYKYSGKELEMMNGLGYYDNNARFLDTLTGGFISRDALASSYPHLSPFANCANNPLRYTDSSGNYLESAWDAVNIGMGISSLWNNIKEGNVGAAIVDGVGVVVDAVALPGVPGGASSIIKAARAADDVVDIAKTGKYSNIPDPKNAGIGKKNNNISTKENIGRKQTAE